MSMLHLQSSVFMDITVSRYTMLIIIHVLCRRSLRLLGFLGLHFVAAQICWIYAKCVLLKSIGGGGVRFAQVLFERDGVNQPSLY